jgi:hypothetical protein
MTNNGTSAAHPPFQLSLRELYALVLLTCCVTWLANMSISSTSAEFLLCVSMATFLFAAFAVWAFKTKRLMLLCMFSTSSAIFFVATDVVPRLLRNGSGRAEHPIAGACKAFAEAQEIYHRTDWDGDGVLEYAQDMQSLVDKDQPGDNILALIDRRFAEADATLPTPVSKAGYFYKILHAHMQNDKWRPYVLNGNMTEGYALVAYPDPTVTTAQLTFVISSTGTIFQKDLGPNTGALVQEMTTFDVSPGSGWVPTE